MTALDRFVVKVDFDGPSARYFGHGRDIGQCWQWLAGKQGKGYGSFGPGGRNRSCLAHRWAYETFVGPIAPDLTVDHLCLNKGCVNPDHMELVSRSLNGRRGGSFRYPKENAA